MATTYSVKLKLGDEEYLTVGAGLTTKKLSAIDLIDYGGAYTWRVSATNEFGTTEGDEWTFYTINFNPPQPSFTLIDGGSGEGPSWADGDGTQTGGVEGTDWEWSGTNNMITLKRLVVAAKYRIWYEV